MTMSTPPCAACTLLLLLLVLLLSSSTSHAQEVAQPVPCLRWAHQSTVAQDQEGNGQSIWIYGGRARTSIGQALNSPFLPVAFRLVFHPAGRSSCADTSIVYAAWTNALIKLDINQPFSIGNPPLEVVQSDRNSSDAPPAVALGALASNGDGSILYQYFGQFSDTPPEDPTSNRLWQYSIPERVWSPVDVTGDPMNRVAEGASALVPSVGTNGEPVSYYFGGHEDV